MTSIVKGLFGGRSSAEKILGRFSPAGFSSSGLSGRFQNNTFFLSRTPGAQAAIDDVRSGFEGRADTLRNRAAAIRATVPTLAALRESLGGQRAGLRGLRGEVQQLRGEVRPGFGRLTRERVDALRDVRRRSVGNLREELSKRRVAGSSFAAREIGALDAQFAQEEDRIRSESLLQELGATGNLIQQELGIFSAESGIAGQQAEIALREAGLTDLSFQSLVEAFESSIAGAQAELQQFNLETGLAAGLSQVASQLINANLTAQAEARAAQEESANAFLAALLGEFLPGGV